jgi:hypothetical protein
MGKKLILSLLAVALTITGSTFEAGAGELKDLVGTWTGVSYPPQGGNPAPATMVVKESGAYEIYIGRGLRFDGRISVDGDRFRWEGSHGLRGTSTLPEEKGKSILRSFREDGSRSGEYEQTKK